MNLKEKFKFMMKMSSLNRFSQTHLTREENVLEHTGFVTMFCYLAGNELIRYQRENSPDIAGWECIDMGTLLSKAVVHDADEIITGDIPRPTKYYNADVRIALQEISEKNMLVVSNMLLGDLVMYSDWEHSKDGVEGFIVAIADAMAVCYKTWQEVIVCGNKAIVEHAVNLKSHLIDRAVECEKIFGKGNPLLAAIEEGIIICDAVQEQRI